jgi:hypothetical protein
LIIESNRLNRGGFTMKTWQEITAHSAQAAFVLALLAWPRAGLAQTQQIAAHNGGSQTGASQPTPFLSKFEARRIRHRCRDTVADPKADREFHHCFEMHIAARRLWGECKQKAKISSLHGREKDESIRRCVIEKLAAKKGG